MTDKLRWMRKHFVLMRHNTVQEAVEFEKYKLRPDLAQFVTADPMSSGEFVYDLQEKGKFKEAHGVTFDELLTKAAEKEADKLFKVDPDSPIFTAVEKLNTDIEAKRQETVDLIKSILPPQDVRSSEKTA